MPILTLAQQELIEELETLLAYYKVTKKAARRGGLATHLRPPVPFYAAPSGSGFTTAVRTFANHHRLRCLTFDATTWVITGAKDTSTFTGLGKQLKETTEGPGLHQVLLINGLHSVTQKADETGWAASVAEEVTALLTHSAHLLNYFPKEAYDNLKNHTITLARGHWDGTDIEDTATWANSEDRSRKQLHPALRKHALNPKAFAPPSTPEWTQIIEESLQALGFQLPPKARVVELAEQAAQTPQHLHCLKALLFEVFKDAPPAPNKQVYLEKKAPEKQKKLGTTTERGT